MSDRLETRQDPYLAYIDRFFRKWQAVYDLFARSIFPVYRSAITRVDPRAGKDVLDICTGTGEIARRCARRGARVTGVDVSEPMLAHARRKTSTLSIRFERMDARRLRFDDCAFDVAVLSFALHDMPRRVRLEVLGEARRVARDRVVVLDYDIPPGLLRRLWIWSINTFETAYFRRFVEEGIDALLDQAQLPVIERARCGPWFGIRVVAASGSSTQPVRERVFPESVSSSASPKADSDIRRISSST